MNKRKMRSSRRRMANRWRTGFKHQYPGFKLVWSKDKEEAMFKPNRAKTRQTLAIRRRNTKRILVADAPAK